MKKDWQSWNLGPFKLIKSNKEACFEIDWISWLLITAGVAIFFVVIAALIAVWLVPEGIVIELTR